jgi:hypothetical protein
MAVIMDFLHAGQERATLPGTEEPMTTVDFITAVFCQVANQMPGIPKHPQASLWPSEVVTLGLLHALKVDGNHCGSWYAHHEHNWLPSTITERLLPSKSVPVRSLQVRLQACS